MLSVLDSDSTNYATWFSILSIKPENKDISDRLLLPVVNDRHLSLARICCPSIDVTQGKTLLSAEY